MLRRTAFRSLLLAVGASLLASCGDLGLTSPAGPAAAVSTPVVAAAVKPTAGVLLQAIWWKKQLKTPLRVTRTIGPAGGSIVIPETGLTVSFPAGAVDKPLAITITSDDKYVAYKMEPSGTKFLKDVTVTQQLDATQIFGLPLKNKLYAAYIPDDNTKLAGKVPVLEIEPSTTIFSALSALLPQAQVWSIRHFSRYMLASD
jgi:hypothetical protein